ncbi:MAG: undecaprenyl-diphosphate phosphatase [Bacteroidota bacterium]
MTWWQAAILGLVQGLAEFLPISSSGHLVLGEYVLGLSGDAANDITFEVFVHFGTTLSIVTVYWRRILRLISGGLKALTQPSTWGESLRAGRIESTGVGAPSPVVSLRLIAFILISMVPTGLVYVLFKDQLEAAFSDPRLVCGMLLVTGTLLLLTLLRKNPQGQLSPVKAILVGVAQSMAMIPGISRSGSTICTAIYLNVDRREAADFSFLMLLPVILGATLLKTLELLETGATVDWVPLLVGTAVAYVSGVWAIKVVIDFVKRGKLQYFAYYCYTVGIFGLVWLTFVA